MRLLATLVEEQFGVADTRRVSMSITWKYIKPLKSDEAVRSYLQRYDVLLPERLIRFLESRNSGRPSSPSFSTNKQDGYVFNSLYSYNAGSVNDIAKTYEQVFYGSRLYPIAIEAAGNVICFDFDKQKLVLWNHENDELELIDSCSNQELFDEII